MNKFRRVVTNIFDLNPDEEPISKAVNRAIYLLIILSTAVVILETLPEFKTRYLAYLYAFETAVTAVFCLELLLRFVVADLLIKKHTSAWERFLLLAYFFIDLAAVLPTFLFIFSPSGEHHDYFLTLRLLRIFKAFRHDHSIELILKAIISKRSELLHSAILVFTFTIFLSVLLYEVENSFEFGNGEVKTPFTDIFTTLAWACSVFVNDAIGYQEAGLLPTTSAGRFIAWIIGFLNIGILVIPTGIIASGFLEVLEENKIQQQYTVLKKAFRKKFNDVLGIEIFERPRTLLTLQNSLFIQESHFYKMLETKQGFRIRAVYSASDEKYNDTNLVEHFAYETLTNYGACIRRTTSSTLIITPNSAAEENIGYYSYCIAEMLQTHYLSNEFYQRNALKQEYDLCFKTNPLYDAPLSENAPTTATTSQKQKKLQTKRKRNAPFVEAPLALAEFKEDIKNIISADVGVQNILLFESVHGMTTNFDIVEFSKSIRNLNALQRFILRLRAFRSLRVYQVRVSDTALSHYDYYAYIKEAGDTLRAMLH